MTTEDEEALADWMIVLGALVLVGSLFLAWSHQITPALRRDFGGGPGLAGVPSAPNAWQVFSGMDVVLTVLGASLAGVALFGSHRARQAASVAVAAGIAFTVHALVDPPTSGLLLIRPGSAAADPVGARYVPLHPSPGVGAALALAGLVLALAGLAISFVSDAPHRPRRPGARLP